MGATLNFTETWIKPLEENYEVIREMYNEAMKKMFKQIPTTMIKSLNPKQKAKKLMKEIGGRW